MISEERKQYEKEYNALKKKHGVCISCGQNEIAPTSTLRCEVCLAKNAEYAKKRRDNMTEEQKAELARKSLSRRRNRDAERKAKGQCVLCDRSAYKNLTVCHEHMLIQRRRKRKSNPPKHYTELGLCRICGGECYQDKKFCKEHYEQYKASMLSARKYLDNSTNPFSDFDWIFVSNKQGKDEKYEQSKTDA